VTLPTVTLWRPVGQAELDQIARAWNTKDPASGNVGYVLRFVDADYVSRFEPQRVGGAGIDELWVPAEQLDEFNDHIVGRIELASEHRPAPREAVTRQVPRRRHSRRVDCTGCPLYYRAALGCARRASGRDEERAHMTPQSPRARTASAWRDRKPFVASPRQ
jgi:hypothetical protein